MAAPGVQRKTRVAWEQGRRSPDWKVPLQPWGSDWEQTREVWSRTKSRFVTWEAGTQWQVPTGQGELRKGRGLSHSLRHVALHTDETRPHKPDLARGHVPTQEPGQAGQLGAQDLDEVTTAEGHLFRPRALAVGHRGGQAHGCRRRAHGQCWVLGRQMVALSRDRQHLSGVAVKLGHHTRGAGRSQGPTLSMRN